MIILFTALALAAAQPKTPPHVQRWIAEAANRAKIWAEAKADNLVPERDVYAAQTRREMAKLRKFRAYAEDQFRRAAFAQIARAYKVEPAVVERIASTRDAFRFRLVEDKVASRRPRSARPQVGSLGSRFDPNLVTLDPAVAERLDYINPETNAAGTGTPTPEERAEKIRQRAEKSRIKGPAPVATSGPVE